MPAAPECLDQCDRGCLLARHQLRQRLPGVQRRHLRGDDRRVRHLPCRNSVQRQLLGAIGVGRRRAGTRVPRALTRRPCWRRSTRYAHAASCGVAFRPTRCRCSGCAGSTGIFFQRAGLRGRRERLLRPAQQLPASCAQHAARHPGITLAVLYIELATQVGLTQRGVSLPGPFPDQAAACAPASSAAGGGRSVSPGAFAVARGARQSCSGPYKRSRGLLGEFRARRSDSFLAGRRRRVATCWRARCATWRRIHSAAPRTAAAPAGGAASAW